MTGQTGQSFRDVINKHNFGFTLQDQGEIKLATASAKIIFHYELPAQIGHFQDDINCSELPTEMRNPCRNVRPLLVAFGRVRTRGFEHLKRELNYIYDIFYEFDSRWSRKRGFFTNVLSSLTGLETKEHVDEMRQIMTKIEKGVLSANEAWRTGSSHFTAAIKIEKSRVDNLQHLLELHRQSLSSMQSEILNTYKARNNMARIIATMLDSLTNLTLQISELDTILAAAESLSKGKIPHMLINHTMLWDSLSYLQSHLNEFELQLVHQDSTYYYKYARFHVFRFKQQLIIRLHVPITLSTLTKPYTVWQLNKIPLASPGQQHYTMLNANFKSILYTADSDYYAVLDSVPDSKIQTLDITTEGIILQDRNVLTCPLSLLGNDLSQIQSYCGYSVVYAPVPKAVIKLTNNLILLSNISRITVQCNNNNISQIIMVTKIQTVYELHCSCSFRADHFYIPHSPLHCDETLNSNLTVEPKYIINLPYVHAYLGKSILDIIQQDDIFNESIIVNLPKLAIAKKVYQNRLSVMQDETFDLATVINETKKDNKVYAGLGHLLLNDILDANLKNSDFDLFNPFTWIQIVIGLIAMAALTLSVLLYCRLRTVMILLAKPIHCAAFPLVIELPTTTFRPATSNETLNYWDYHKKLTELVPIDISFLLCFLLFLIFFLWRYCTRCVHEILNRNVRTKVYLELTDQTNTVTFKVAKLPYNASFYRFTVNPQFQAIKLEPRCCYAILDWTKTVTVYNLVLECTLSLKCIGMNYIKARRVRQVLSGLHAVTLQVVTRNDELLEVITLYNTLQDVKAGITRQQEERDKLYPTLPAY